MKQYMLKQIVAHCTRCERCAALAKKLIDEKSPYGLDVQEFEALDESIGNCPNR
jgi:hypothetical protein